MPEPKTNYEKGLVAAKPHLSFLLWSSRVRPAIAGVFDQLIVDLIAAGEGAGEIRKLDCFNRAAVSLNAIHRRDLAAIETIHAEQLVEIGNEIAKAAGLDAKKYGAGEGPLSAGREW